MKRKPVLPQTYKRQLPSENPKILLIGTYLCTTPDHNGYVRVTRDCLLSIEAVCIEEGYTVWTKDLRQ